MPTQLAITTLINERCATLGINRRVLAHRLGYSNTAKGIRRIGALCDGRLEGLGDLISKLHVGLDVAAETVSAAIRDTEAEIAERDRDAELEADRRWRESFRPHAVILTERSVPSQITVCAMIRGERGLWIDLDNSRPRSTFKRQAMRELSLRLSRTGGVIPFFGEVTGLAINLSPDLAIRYDADGKALGIVGRAFRIGQSETCIGRKVIPIFRPSGDAEIRC